MIVLIVSSFRGCGEPRLAGIFKTVGAGGGCVNFLEGSTGNWVASGDFDSASPLRFEPDPEIKCSPGLAAGSVGIVCGRTGDSLVPSIFPSEIVVEIKGGKGARDDLCLLLPSACVESDSGAGLLGLLIATSDGLVKSSEKYPESYGP